VVGSHVMRMATRFYDSKKDLPCVW